MTSCNYYASRNESLIYRPDLRRSYQSKPTTKKTHRKTVVPDLPGAKTQARGHFIVLGFLFLFCLCFCFWFFFLFVFFLFVCFCFVCLFVCLFVFNLSNPLKMAIKFKKKEINKKSCPLGVLNSIRTRDLIKIHLLTEFLHNVTTCVYIHSSI